MDKKVTKRMCFNALMDMIDVCANTDVDFDLDDLTYDDLREMINTEIASLDNKAARAKEKAEEKKKLGDELREKVLSALDSQNYMIVDDIVSIIGNGCTSQEVTHRLTQLISLGQAEKDKVKVEFTTDDGSTKTKTRTGYRRIG